MNYVDRAVWIASYAAEMCRRRAAAAQHGLNLPPEHHALGAMLFANDAVRAMHAEMQKRAPGIDDADWWMMQDATLYPLYTHQAAPAVAPDHTNDAHAAGAEGFGVPSGDDVADRGATGGEGVP